MPAILSAYTGSVGTVLSPSGDTTGVKDSAAITAAISRLPAKGGTVTLNPSGTWYLNAGGISVTQAGIWINAPGTYISGVGTGDLIRMQSTDSTFAIVGGGVVGFPTFDGTNMGAGSCPVHLGDFLQAQVEAYVQNFTGTGSIGVHFDNANLWTEQILARIYASNCTQHVVFDVSGALTSTQSYGRADVQVYVNQSNAAYDGLVVQNGAEIYDGAIALRGNFIGSSSALTSCALRITGTVPAGHPGAGNPARVTDCRLDFGLECGSGAHTPTTIIRGSNSNGIFQCYGIMDFGGQSSAANFTAAATIGIIFPFNGAVFGDAVLSGASAYPIGVTWGAPASIYFGDFTTATVPTTGSTIATFPVKGVFRVNPAGNITGVILGAGNFDGQVAYLLNESAFTITFAASGTSHVADGASDVIAAKTGATFVYDGADTALWYRC